MNSPLATDLDHVIACTRDLWGEVRGQRLFLTGGTGFFGKWLVESFCWANTRLQLDASLLVLSRDPQTFCRAMPHLAGRSDLAFHAGDVRSFVFPAGKFSHVVHAATPSSGLPAEGHELALYETIVGGTLHVLDFARQCRVKKLLLTSSGAVYGRQPTEMARVPEDYAGAPDTVDLRATYGHGKRMAEHLCAIQGSQYEFEAKIARCFAFVGPHLPLDAHFAVGNFIRDGLRGGPIQVAGDGTPQRSYLYAADLAAWLWTILFRGTANRPYNVGSDAAQSIAELAAAVAAAFDPSPTIAIARQADPAAEITRYVPSCERARRELSLDTRVSLPESIRRTVLWHQRQTKP